MPKRPDEERRAVIGRAVDNNLFKPADNSGVIDDLGFPTVSRPTASKKVDPQFNVDLPTISSQDLSRYLQYASGMLSYAISCTAAAAVKENAVRTALIRTASKKRVVIGSGRKKFELEDAVKTDPEVMKLQTQLDTAEAARTLLEAHVQSFTTRVQLFSREMSRRSNDQQRGT